MKICLLGLENLPVLAPQYAHHQVGGAQVQQTLLARALVRAGHDVSMVIGDYGQPDGSSWDGIRTYKAYAADAGLPVLRYIHPRWTSVWSALRRAEADVYYTSCAGMQVGLLAAFCRRHGKRFIFRVASDTDCDPSRLLVRYARDRWLYEYGLRHADTILVQNSSQASLLAHHYALPSRKAASLIEKPERRAAVDRDIDVLWVNNVRPLKRPDLMLALAESLPDVRVHLVGGPMPGDESLYREVQRKAAMLPNVAFHGRLSYAEANDCHLRSRLLVSTSDAEGFPNTYLQSWIRGVPVVARQDPDRLIERERLGVTADSLAGLRSAIVELLSNAAAWTEASERCLAFMVRRFSDSGSIAPYLEAFESLATPPTKWAAGIAQTGNQNG